VDSGLGCSRGRVVVDDHVGPCTCELYRTRSPNIPATCMATKWSEESSRVENSGWVSAWVSTSAWLDDTCPDISDPCTHHW
jgi:hypothetical protein